MGQYTTIEYVLNRTANIPPIFLFVVDTCMDEDDLEALKETLLLNLAEIPPYALVGLITFGTVVQVHELGFNECSKSYVFRGSKDYDIKTIQDSLGLSAANPARQQQQGPSHGNRFLLPLDQCEFNLTSAIEGLQRDPWPVKEGHRYVRASGAALAVAVGLLEVNISRF